MRMDTQKSLKIFWQEFRKDALFFGVCGIVVGVFELLQRQASKGGPATPLKWGDALFVDFVPVHACALLFFASIAIACLATVLSSDAGQASVWDELTSHVQIRWTQLSSSIVAFLAGFSAIALLHALVTHTLPGAELALLCLFLSGELLGTLWIGGLVASRVQPFDRKIVAVVLLILTLCVLWWLIHYASK
jgi:hypothetical protein